MIRSANGKGEVAFIVIQVYRFSKDGQDTKSICQYLNKDLPVRLSHPRQLFTAFTDIGHSPG